MWDAIVALLKAWFTPEPASITSPIGNNTLRKGMKGASVGALQLALQKYGYYKSAIDNSFGPVTERAVKAYQADNDLAVDGVAGPKTLKALQKYSVPAVDQPSPAVDTKPVQRSPAQDLADFLTARMGWTEFTHNKQLSVGWQYTVLKYFNSVIGRSNAWCMMILCYGLGSKGWQHPNSGLARALQPFATKHKRWINHKTMGIPKNALVQKNSGGQNHVFQAAEAISAADCNRAGATIPGRGGNQNNAINVTVYPISEIECVSWYPEMPLPEKVTVSTWDVTRKSNGGATR